MNFLLDNNLPPALAKALHELSKTEGHRVIALREKFQASTPDIEWITKLREEGHWVVVSKDKFSKGSMEKRAFAESGLAIFVLAKQWQHMTFWDTAHNLVRWWPAITEQAQRISGGGVFKVSWRFTAPGKFEVVRI